MRCCRCKSPRRGRRNSQRWGFTLLEVVVGLALMAGVLVSSLLAFSAHQRQRRLAEAQLAAVAIADELLEQFSHRRSGWLSAGRAAVPGKPGWFWQVGVVGTAAPAGVPVQVVRLQIVEVTDAGATQTLASVDVVEKVP